MATSLVEMDELQTMWKELLRCCPRTMFQTFEWNRLAAKIFSDRLSLKVCAAETATGGAIIPAVLDRKVHRLELIGEQLFDYRTILHSGEADALYLAWEMLERIRAPLCATALEEKEAQSLWSDFQPAEYAQAPWVDAAKITAAKFRQMHTRAERQLRRMHRLGIALRQYSGAEFGLVEQIYRLKCDQFRDDSRNIFRDKRRRDFMAAIAAAEGESCGIFTLEDSTRAIVAALVTFRDGATFRFYTIYYDPAWAAYSPGVALVYEATALCLEQGLSCDYMTGEYPYKLRFANATRRLYRVDISSAQFAAIARRQIEFRAA
ncbi:MAG: GNAT family N-acetyltransferase [Candidatus Eremiobacteraeota bacterium]|nr:GNAT family N-acetyltransferase [Candidatus Eremiobacteraeota bacterium]